MNSASVDGRNLVKIDNKKAEILKKKFNQFKSIFDQEQSKFTTSQDTEYYIVSSKYLKQWTQYYGSHQAERYEPRPMNQDLMDAGGQLRKGLTQSKDFQIINQKVYNLIRTDTGFQLQRSAIFVGTQKRVPIYLDFIKDVHDIDYKKIHAKDLKIKLCEISIQSTIQKLIQKIKDIETVGNRYKARVWKNNINDLSMQTLHKYIKQKTQKISNYRFDGVGKLIEDEKTILQQLNLQQDDYFICEVSDQYSTFYFKSDSQAKCEGCYKYKKLNYVCGCKVVAYCTLECQEKDRRFHIRDCKFAEEQQLNQQIQMKFTSSSSLGKVGLSNLGNTCFMNSCLQCLSNTTLLTEYFVKKYFDKEINKDNVLGSKGKLAKNYAKFIKNMWCGSESTYSPHNLKGAVAHINPIFSGYAQHDSQQFFSFIADGIHEDLNRVIKKPYVESIDSKNRSDEVVATQSWIAYTSRNQSIIVDLLTGQYKSKVICPTCNLQSITFDPFTTISLPVPEEPTIQTMKYYIIYNNNQKQAQKMSFQYIKGNAKQWLQTATKMLKRDPSDFTFYVLTVLENIYGFENNSKAQIVHKIQVQNKNVFLLQLSQEQKKIKQKVELVTRYCKKLNFQKQYDNLWFKRPFFFQKSTTTGLTIYRRLLKYIYQIFVNKKSQKYQQFQQKMIAEQPFSLVFKYKKTIQRYYGRIQVKFDKEVVISNLSTKLQQLLDLTNAGDYQIDARFNKDSVKLFQFDKLKKYSDADQVKLKKLSHKDNSAVTIDQCFKVFQEKQQLQVGNQWYCPKCKQHRLATKQMTIYKAPQILILHLKRFKNKGTWRKQKNQTNVQFPLVLNMKQYIINPDPMSTYIPQLKSQGKYIEPSFTAQYKKSQPIYELYAISNHYGGLGGGHYTAYAKNKQKWYQFNDSSVHAVSQDSIKGSGAYMLFYRRKDSMFIK